MSMEINEAEEYLGLLRERQAAVQRRLRQADEQIGVVRDALRSDGIAELSSDDGDGSSDEVQHHVSSEDIIPPFSSYQSDLDLSDPEGDTTSESFDLSCKSSHDTPFTKTHSNVTSPLIGGVKLDDHEA